jgi:hypothetical protein
VRTLAEAVGALRGELADGRDPNRTQALAIEATKLASAAYKTGVGFSGGVVVAQIRSAALDLLVATGVPESEASRAIRQLRDAS